MSSYATRWLTVLTILWPSSALAQDIRLPEEDWRSLPDPLADVRSLREPTDFTTIPPPLPEMRDPYDYTAPTRREPERPSYDAMTDPLNPSSPNYYAKPDDDAEEDDREDRAMRRASHYK